MEHQDWNTVIIRGKTKGSKNVQTCVEKRPVQKQVMKDVDIHENGPEAKISSELRKKLIEARNGKKMAELAAAAGQCGKKLTQKDIQQAEQGLCTMKQGKQIALIYERVLKMKIL